MSPLQYDTDNDNADVIRAQAIEYGLDVEYPKDCTNRCFWSAEIHGLTCPSGYCSGRKIPDFEDKREAILEPSDPAIPLKTFLVRCYSQLHPDCTAGDAYASFNLLVITETKETALGDVLMKYPWSQATCWRIKEIRTGSKKIIEVPAPY